MIELTQHTLPLPYLPAELDGIRVIQISDLHRSRYTSDERLKRAIRIANGACPDLILLTGDYVTDDPADIDPCGHILSELLSPMGIYAVLGNHDVTADSSGVERMLHRLDITVLTNRNIKLTQGLWIAGLEDDRHGQPDISRALHGAPDNSPLILLTHNPKNAELASHKECLALSGHTHGGQIRLPFITAREVQRIGAGSYRAGWYTIGKVKLYVNRGLGQVGLPLRFLCRPEISLFTLTCP